MMASGEAQHTKPAHCDSSAPEPGPERLEQKKAYHRRRYRERKARGVCSRCDNKVVPGKSKCPDHAGRTGSRSVCHQCYQRPSIPGKGQRYCSDCRPVVDTEIKTRRQRYANDYKNIKRQEWKQAGICNLCGQRPAESGNASCAPCRENRNRLARRQYRLSNAETKARNRARVTAYQRARRRRLMEAGLCVSCGKQPASDNRRNCQDCRDEMSRLARQRYWNQRDNADRAA